MLIDQGWHNGLFSKKNTMIIELSNNIDIAIIYCKLWQLHVYFTFIAYKNIVNRKEPWITRLKYIFLSHCFFFSSMLSIWANPNIHLSTNNKEIESVKKSLSFTRLKDLECKILKTHLFPYITILYINIYINIF